MKYQLETIPVLDAFKRDTECPLCFLEHKTRDYYIKFYLGNSVMVPETRVKVNQTYFCPEHLPALYNGGNKLGLALVTQTHIQELMKQQEKLWKSTRQKLDCGQNINPKKLDRIIQRINEQVHACLVCQNIEETMQRYIFTILYLYKTEPVFQQQLTSSRGFCLKHLGSMLVMARTQLDTRELGQWLSLVLEKHIQSFKQLEGDLYTYTQKFDYRGKDLPWGNAKDALHRALLKLASCPIAAEERNP